MLASDRALVKPDCFTHRRTTKNSFGEGTVSPAATVGWRSIRISLWFCLRHSYLMLAADTGEKGEAATHWFRLLPLLNNVPPVPSTVTTKHLFCSS